MRAPVSWVGEYVDLPTGLTPRELGDALVQVGLEVERVESGADGLSGPIVVGRVLSFDAELQKNGKTIRWCQVDVGAYNLDGEPRGIVCGAGNFAVGDLIVASLPGAVLPGGFTIAARKTYGHVSDGMICSVRELGIGDDHDGILILPADSATPGADALDVLGLREAVLDIAVTPDRGYCLSVRGLAREASLALNTSFRDINSVVDVPAPGPEVYPARVEDPTACPVFSLRAVRGLNVAAASPKFIQQRLQFAGVRPISLAVDVTNYVMLETGQPLHAYDRAKLAGEIVVRRAAAGEKITTLDDNKRTLDVADLVIADDSGAIGLAGVMGGASTEITTDTEEIVLEAAYFEPATVARAVRRHKLPSEAAKRFERGVDPRVAAVALQRAVDLLVEYGAATAVDGFTVVGSVPSAPEIEIAADFPGALAGLEIATDVVVAKLTDVGCEVDVETESGRAENSHHRVSGPRLHVVPPSWRPDLTDPADLVEEVIRLVGYDKVPSALPSPPPGRGLTAEQRSRRAVSRALAAAGYTEVLSYPFVSPAVHDSFGLPAEDPRRRAVRLVNPLSDAEPELRTSLLPGLLATVARNLGRGSRDLQLFEMGLVFLPSAEAVTMPTPGVEHRPSDEELAGLIAGVPDQPRYAAVVLTGEFEQSGWWGAGRSATWADAIEAGRSVAAAVRAEITVQPTSYAPWHPGRAAEIRLDGVVVGHAGELHPRVVAALSLPERTCAMEINLDAFAPPAPVVAPTLADFPPALLDVALVVPDGVAAAALTETIRRAGGPLLESARLFDVYVDDERLGAGLKSLAFALRLRAGDRTLTAAEAIAVRDQVVDAAAAQHGARLRD
ncbi:phenylalanyl-tRNA synthetase beta subunit [Jatrophihabitans sp. GAS493]|uniref:phenylalanine--tRNA ligase subunit beta n=1 Tax=Jatrophihabitans sp. GAS493 TaxID=1907575 RepID=UPI000BB7CDCB|nr:phenylalanine--tRNA ligase subunit beta [Jatrophihabitans sp. GAS493]SOD73769.1 phenylalanyl-tRNA synthetase beta subunit [Jatrophihabitans sp. GAS493]